MLAYLNGKLIKKTSTSLIIETNGVGYRVHVLPHIVAEVHEGDRIKLYVHQYVREDEISLYGFKRFAQLETFELLISISGVGPKLAFNIISTTSQTDLQAAVAKSDISFLTRIPGIGRKSAAKILLELANKLDLEQSMDKLFFSPEDKLAMEALKKLGFKTSEAREAIEKSGKYHVGLEDKIRASLKYLNK